MTNKTKKELQDELDCANEKIALLKDIVEKVAEKVAAGDDIGEEKRRQLAEINEGRTQELWDKAGEVLHEHIAGSTSQFGSNLKFTATIDFPPLPDWLIGTKSEATRIADIFFTDFIECFLRDLSCFDFLEYVNDYGMESGPVNIVVDKMLAVIEDDTCEPDVVDTISECLYDLMSNEVNLNWTHKITTTKENV